MPKPMAPRPTKPIDGLDISQICSQTLRSVIIHNSIWLHLAILGFMRGMVRAMSEMVARSPARDATAVQELVLRGVDLPRRLGSESCPTVNGLG